MSAVLGVFAKWPTPGAVKTRLGLPPQRTAQVACAFLRDTLDRLASLAVRRVLVFSPAEAEEDFAALAVGRYALAPQGEGVLGARLHRFFADELAQGSRRVVVVGSDSPTLPPEHVEAAFAALATADVVVGPATDGGYYLLGCGARLPPVFDDMPWSGPDVLAETVARLADPSWRLAVLPPWYDVDTPEGWALLRGHVAALRRSGIDPGVPHTEAELRADR
jgi:rSAM/selenodomain-associated transferase 1